MVASPNWINGAIHSAGAVTWENGAASITDTVATTNSLVGATAGDFVGGRVMSLNNGNYVILSPDWHNGASAGAGAVTWGNGATGVKGVISAANSLVGSTAGDQVGSGIGVSLNDGNYMAQSPHWHNGAAADAGAVTWGNGATGVSGVVSSTNSLVGSTAGDQVGSGGITVLFNGNYVIFSPRLA